MGRSCPPVPLGEGWGEGRSCPPVPLGEGWGEGRSYFTNSSSTFQSE